MKLNVAKILTKRTSTMQLTGDWTCPAKPNMPIKQRVYQIKRQYTTINRNLWILCPRYPSRVIPTQQLNCWTSVSLPLPDSHSAPHHHYHHQKNDVQAKVTWLHLFKPCFHSTQLNFCISSPQCTMCWAYQRRQWTSMQQTQCVWISCLCWNNHQMEESQHIKGS
jgi:hypothetical protein